VFEREARGEHGGTHYPEGSNQHTKEVNVDNIHVDQEGTERPPGTSRQAGLRRLDKAAQAGDLSEFRYVQKGRVPATSGPAPPSNAGDGSQKRTEVGPVRAGADTTHQVGEGDAPDGDQAHLNSFFGSGGRVGIGQIPN
jgi:hypothetical protein